MNKVIILIIGSILTVFFHSLFDSAGLISFVLIISLLIYDRISPIFLMVFLGIFSVAIDSFWGLYIGSHYFVLLLTISVMAMSKRFFPQDSSIARGLITILIVLIYHILVYLLITTQTGGTTLVDALRSSIGSMIIEAALLFILLSILDNNIGKGISNLKLKV